MFMTVVWIHSGCCHSIFYTLSRVFYCAGHYGAACGNLYHLGVEDEKITRIFKRL